MTFLLSNFFRVDSAILDKKRLKHQCKSYAQSPYQKAEAPKSPILCVIHKNSGDEIVSISHNNHCIIFDERLWTANSNLRPLAAVQSQFELPIDKFQLKLFNHKLFLIPLKISPIQFR